MEAQSVSEQEHIIEVSADVVPNGTVHIGQIRRLCGRSACGLSDATNNSTEAKERTASMRKLVFAVVLCVVFMVVEVVGGIKANSLAILTDAAHLLSDVAAFAISLFSLWASGWEANPRQSYGFFRIEIIGALLSIQLIWLLTGILVFEAIQRLLHGTAGEVHGVLMFGVSVIGLMVNIAMALILGKQHHGHSHGAESGHKKQQNINVRSAYLHVLGDLVQSIVVLIDGAIIWFKPEWKIVDLICTLLSSIIVLGTTIRMLRNILEVLMESTPREIDATRLEKGLCDQMEEIVTIHELHIWAITVGKVLLACHVIIKPDADAEMVRKKVIDYIRREYNISHVTIQIERGQA